MEQYEINWKNYYEILQVSPDAEPKAIAAAYERLVHLFHHSLSDRTKESRFFSGLMDEVNEAYQVLSDPRKRRAYDQIFREKCVSQQAKVQDTTTKEIIYLTEPVDKGVPQRKRRERRKIPGWTRGIPRAILVAVISLLLIFAGGSSFAIAKPEHTAATPFRGAAITALKASSGAIGLIEDIRGVVARYERNIVYTSLQSMRVIEGLKDVPPVTVPTNDMTCFPSPGHPLFPDYLDKKFSQFQYTVDSDGIVTVHTSDATTDSFLEKIRQLLNRLDAE